MSTKIDVADEFESFVKDRLIDEIIKELPDVFTSDQIISIARESVHFDSWREDWIQKQLDKGEFSQCPSCEEYFTRLGRGDNCDDCEAESAAVEMRAKEREETIDDRLYEEAVGK